jgi:hypothetical protein
MIYKNFVVLDENCHWLKLMYLFLRHVVYLVIYHFPGNEHGNAIWNSLVNKLPWFMTGLSVKMS